jgi:superoxide dismutase, Fe-Mn family
MSESVMPPGLTLGLSAAFGSVERWKADLLQRWAEQPQLDLTLALSLTEGRLVHRSTGGGHSMDQHVPILTIKAPHKSVELGSTSILEGVDWPACQARYKQAIEQASAALGIDAQACSGAQLVDVRRAAVFDAAPSCIAGAPWRDPTAVEAWAHEAWGDRTLVVYCVHGHEVSRATALRVQAKGVRARFLVGGMEAWHSMGLPVEAKEPVKAEKP